MDLRFCFCCFYLWTSVLLRRASSAPEPAPQYLLQQAELAFHEANAACSNGSLTTLRTEQEVQRVLRQVPSAGSDQRRMFWVGLEKVKSECVIQALPLRGFKWVVDNSEETQVSRWLEEPKYTCTRQCVALAVEGSGSNTTRWGLVPVSCKSNYKYICKLEGTQQLRAAVIGGAPGEQTPTVPEAEPTETDVGTVQPGSSPTPAEASPGLKSTSSSPEEPEPSEASAHNITEPEVPLKPAVRSEEPGPKPVPGSRACSNPDISRARSLRLDPSDVNRILLECWSGVKLPLVCSGRPAAWRLLDNSTVNASTVCQHCSPGSVVKCEDINTCETVGARCRHSCQNLNGTDRCVCLDQDGNAHEADFPECSAREGQGWIMGILLPVLVAVAVLLVVVVVVTVTVKRCLKRRSKTRAVKKAEKMAMRSKEDTFDTANETAA